jgi:hypothetical protein
MDPLLKEYANLQISPPLGRRVEVTVSELPLF